MKLSLNLKPWQLLSRKLLVESKSGLFKIFSEACRTNRGHFVDEYFILDCPDWVHVVAYTPSGRYILVHQFRQGVRDFCWELPGGSLDHSKELPLEAAQRELLEETGFTSKDWVSCGTLYPNPALQNNRIHVFIAKNCSRSSDQSLDPCEEIEVAEMTRSELNSLIAQKDGLHALMLASILWSFNHLDQN